MMDAIENALVAPEIEITVHCSFGGQIFGKITPLTSGAQNIHEAIHHLPQVHRALAAAAFGWWDQWRDKRPFFVRQVARIAQLAAIVSRPILDRPHWRPLHAGRTP
jgi:hypothetical protein